MYRLVESDRVNRIKSRWNLRGGINWVIKMIFLINIKKILSYDNNQI